MRGLLIDWENIDVIGIDWGGFRVVKMKNLSQVRITREYEKWRDGFFTLAILDGIR